jgi:hypothetical protein
MSLCKGRVHACGDRGFEQWDKETRAQIGKLHRYTCIPYSPALAETEAPSR